MVGYSILITEMDCISLMHENNTITNGNIKDAVKKTLVEKDGQVLTNSYSYAKYDFSGSAV